ncbi:hypothetical protein IHN32_01840 [Deinococcus sp. 14RED07]|uniref:hypothetical protein n=1 Tax=Deinococcus sp. 14RED07 TaxID=2745874 RepID=UPI001E33F58E|nr:hypothetical protein [Deinococcus sp. 14RED07]MCD0174695.1 hypothetical protein [Deinococcus sp. 14RED07]
MSQDGQRLPPLVRLSEEIAELGLPQQADKFVKLLRAAVKDSVVSAAYTGQRFDLPKQYRFKKTPDSVSKRKRAVEDGQEVYTRRTPEMVILKDQAYLNWFAATKHELFLIQFPSMRADKKGKKGTPNAEAMLGDPTRALFWASVEATRERIAHQEQHGRKLATGKGFHAAATEGGEQQETPAAQPPRQRATQKKTATPKEPQESGKAAKPARKKPSSTLSPPTKGESAR